MADINKATYVEELETVWRCGKDSPSLLGDGWRGCTLSDAAVDDRKKARRKSMIDAHRERTYAAAKRDFAWYEGKK